MLNRVLGTPRSRSRRWDSAGISHAFNLEVNNERETDTNREIEGQTNRRAGRKTDRENLSRSRDQPSLQSRGKMMRETDRQERRGRARQTETESDRKIDRKE